MLLGFGLSNQSIQKFFDKKGIEYLIYDDNIDKYCSKINISEIDYIIKSGSISNDHEYIKNNKKKVISDIELYSLFFDKNEIIAVTGTNGKTTTVNLIKQLLNKTGQKITMCGNVGIPIFDVCEKKDDFLIEVSSYMSEYINKFKANYNVFLNINANHIDHHKNINGYIKAKIKMLKNIEENDYIIYNKDDIILKRVFANYKCLKISFSLENRDADCFVYNEKIYFNKKEVGSLKKYNLLGKHNIYNLMAAICALFSYTGKVFNIDDYINDFHLPSHRLEYVGIHKNILFYNDSKSTNFYALNAALSSFYNKRINLICGGKIQKEKFELKKENTALINEIFLYGENKEQLEKYFRELQIKTRKCDTLESAMIFAFKDENNVDIVLFSPGSVSFDQFDNFEERGKSAKEIFKKMKKPDYK